MTPVTKPERIAVVLFNLGGPESEDSVRPFLFNFFTDRNIIGLPFPFRHMIAAWIALRRSRREAGSSYKLLDWKSPLLENSQAQADALEAALQPEPATYKTFVCMRYWHPLADEVAAAVKAFAPDRIVLLPLYPQYSTTTSRSSFQSWTAACRAAGLDAPTASVCCYPTQVGFVAASAGHIAEIWRIAVAEARANGWNPPRLLFSAHGLPEIIIKKGDPYQWQCERSAQAIVDALAIPGLDWQICYQSKVGRMTWIGPSTTDALQQAARDQVPVVIYPHAFVSEHVETLVEIEVEYRHMARELGVPALWRAGTVMAAPDFIVGLRDTVVAHAGRDGVKDADMGRVCPAGFGRCAQVDPMLDCLRKGASCRAT